MTKIELFNIKLPVEEKEMVFLKIFKIIENLYFHRLAPLFCALMSLRFPKMKNCADAGVQEIQNE